MKFGILWDPWIGGDDKLGEIVDSYSLGAEEAERFGYDGLFLADHSNPRSDTWTNLSYLAAKTTSIRLGSGVTLFQDTFLPNWQDR